MTNDITVEFRPFGTGTTGTANPPHQTQARILEWSDRVRAGQSGCAGIPTLYVQGGVRSGKTTAVLTIIHECMEAYPGLRVLIARKDFQDLRVSTYESWKGMRLRELVAHENSQEHREEWVNGSQVFFRELKDLEGLGGQEFGIILVSEPYELDGLETIHRLRGRLSQHGMPLMLLLEGNPANEGHFLHTFICGSDDGRVVPDADTTFIECPTDENWENLPAPYRRTIETAPESWQKKYRLGKWGFTPSGQPVYDLFKETIHVRPISLIPDRPVIRSWDSGARHPACLWSQIAANGQLIIQYEWLGIEVGLSQFAPGVIQRTNEWYGPQAVMDYGDPAMFARSPQTGKSDAQVLFDHARIQLHGRQSTHQDRKSLIDGRFSLLIQGAPAILIHPRCKTLIEGLLGGYHYPTRTDNQPFNKRQEAPYKDGWYEHLVNCFEYLMVNSYGRGNTLTTEVIARNRRRQQMRVNQLKTAAVF